MEARGCEDEDGGGEGGWWMFGGELVGDADGEWRGVVEEKGMGGMEEVRVGEWGEEMGGGLEVGTGG